MVRFIIFSLSRFMILWSDIYIPIWLDLLFRSDDVHYTSSKIYIPIWLDLLWSLKVCQFSEYEIYIPIWLDLLLKANYQNTTQNIDLHSNMVRFIINEICYIVDSIPAFTFQYGQIYYQSKLQFKNNRPIIYIPIWLDLLFPLALLKEKKIRTFTFQYGQIYYVFLMSLIRLFFPIYIPIWLDLLSRD